MKRTFIAIGLALMLGTSVQAKTPKEVLVPYKAYRTALAEKNDQLAAEKAFEAWQVAEKLMGDKQTTGDLAANFAELNPRFLDNKQAWKHIIKAHKRAIDLSELYEEDPGGVEIDRRTKYLTWLVSSVKKNSGVGWERKYGPRKLNERIVELGLEGTTFDAESVAFSAQLAMLDKDWKEAETQSKAAMELFEARTDGIFSVYEYAVPIYLARSYAETGRSVDAALTYQNLMTKLEQGGGHKNPISGESYAEWIRLRDEIISTKNPDPRAGEVINFLVPSGRTAELEPLVRKPPKIPSSFLRGSKSGFVRVKFNVDIEGRVVDPIILSSTNKSLHDATLESLKGWRYTPNLPEARSRDVETKIAFKIVDRDGKLLPNGTEKSR